MHINIAILNRAWTKAIHKRLWKHKVLLMCCKFKEILHHLKRFVQWIKLTHKLLSL